MRSPSMLQQLIDYIKKEWTVLSGAPGAFVGLVVVCLLSGLALASWHFSGQIATLSGQISSKDGEISRYRVALGIDKASKGAMVELTNEELYARAVSLTSSVRDLCVSYGKRKSAIDKTFRSNDRAMLEADDNLAREITTEYHKSFRSDITIVINEMLRRLDKKTTAAVARPVITDADTGTPIDILTLFPSNDGSASMTRIEASSLCPIADESEQLSKLLPVQQAH
jgi:hypothetical protein